jgi:hypothetical protein
MAVRRRYMRSDSAGAGTETLSLPLDTIVAVTCPKDVFKPSE